VGNPIEEELEGSTVNRELSQLKASAFFSLQKLFSCYETKQLILGTGTAIWWMTEPHWRNSLQNANFTPVFKNHKILVS
jgi:hypothetical protein